MTLDTLDTLDTQYYNLTRRVIQEQVGVRFQCSFKNSICARQESILFFERSSGVAKKRSEEEQDYYNHIKYGLIHTLEELKAYQDINVLDTRRWVFTNLDCISFVQILIRDKITVMVQMRSSDLLGALPGDIRFFSSLPDTLLNFLESKKDQEQYSEIPLVLSDLRLRPIELIINFGSLHIA